MSDKIKVKQEVYGMSNGSTEACDFVAGELPDLPEKPKKEAEPKESEEKEE